jgi:hypothetical protein
MRSGDDRETRFDLICPHALFRLARRYAEGSAKYGDDNWTKGIPIQNLLNHVLRHLNMFREGDLSDDHLAGAMWGIAAIMHTKELCKCHITRAFFARIDAIYLEENAPNESR